MEVVSLNNRVRLLELVVRKQFLEKTLSETKETANNKAMLMLSKAFDDEAESKVAGTIVILEKWLKEIDDEIKELHDPVMEELTDEWKAQVFSNLDEQAKETKE